MPPAPKRFSPSEVVRYEYNTYSSGAKRRIAVIACRGGCGAEVRLNQGEKTGRCRTCDGRRRRQTRPYEALYNMFVGNARRRGLDVLLSFEDFLRFTEHKECAYCGSEVHWQEHLTSRRKESRKYNLDRKDNSLPYSSDNVVVCCTDCNYMRGARFTYEEFLTLSPVLREIQERRRNGNYED